MQTTQKKSVKKTAKRSPSRLRNTASAKTSTRKKTPVASTAKRRSVSTKNPVAKPVHKRIVHHIKRLGAWGFIDKRLLVFLISFMLIGGGYLAYRSFADTTLVLADGEFTSLTPARILDTRTTIGGINHAIGEKPVAVQITGQGGVPASGVKAVVMNVTVTNPTSLSSLTVWQSGATRPNTSNLNFVAGQTIANQVTVPVGADGKVLLSNNNGTTHVIFDIAGFYTDQTGSRGGRLTSISPVRVLDTRTTTGGINAPIGQVPATLQVTGSNGIPSANVTAVVANITVTGSTANSNVTLWPFGASKPTVSNINFAAGQTLANTVTLKVGPDGKINISNNTGATHVILDITGYYTTPQAGFMATQQGRFVSLNSARIFDTLSGTGGSNRQPLGAGATYSAQVTGAGGVVSTNVDAVVLNVTVTNASTPSFLTLYPGKTARPATSNVNFGANQTISNQVVMKVGTDGKVNMYNLTGNVDVIIDVAGYYIKENDNVFASQAGYVSKPLNNIAKQVDFDFSLTTLPTSSGAGFWPAATVGTPNSSVSGLYPRWIINNGGPANNYMSYYCNVTSKCEVLMPGSTSTTLADGSKIHTIPYSISASKVYKGSYQLLTNTPGHTGVWEKLVISVDGTATPIAMQYIGPASGNYNFFGVENSQTTNNSCNSPQAYSTSLKNIKFDGVLVGFSQLGQFLSPVTSNTPNCPGFANLSFSPAADGSLVMTHNYGIIKSKRDTTPPNVTSMTVSGRNVTTVATDDTAIASYYINVDNIGFTQSNEIATLSKTGFANTITKTSNVYPTLSAGPHTVTVTITDTSGNTTVKSTLINI